MEREINKKLVINLHIVLYILYYLVMSYLFWTFDLTSIWPDSRFAVISFGMIYMVALEMWFAQLYSSTDFLDKKPHTEKISWIKKYCWELKEELKLLWEARDLEIKIHEFVKQKKKL